MRKVVLGTIVGPVLQLLEEKIDLGVAHLHAVLYLALAQPPHDHLLANLVSPGVEGDAVGLQRLAKVGERHVVRLRDALDGPVELQLDRAVERIRSEEHTSELQSHSDLVCRLLLEKKNDRT